nr:S8 family serine peptidase [uncultured Draconibacterium sp.]
MKKLLLKLLSIVVLAGFFQSCQETFVEDESSNEIQLKSASTSKSGYIVVLQDAEVNQELSKLKGYEKKQAAMKSVSAKILKRAGITDGEIGHVFGTALQGFSVKIPPGQLKKLEDDPSVKYIQVDRIISLGLPELSIKKKPAPTPPAQSVPWGISRVNGGINYSGGNVAWIVDTGIDTDHPDLNVDVSRSQTFVTTEPIPSVEDLNGHGTHVAGTIAAKNDDIGVVGVAAGATVISCRVLDRSGSGSFSWTVAALDYIASVGSAGDVVNMSLGPSSPYIDPAVDEAVQTVAALGIKISIAAGNESDDCDLYSPAHNDGTNIYTISASDVNDDWAYFSNYGDPVDFCEPGYSIYSTYLNGGYATLSGTSMAAPHAAGILLLGDISPDGTVSGDPDGNADPIGVGGGDTPPPANVAPTADFTFSVTNLSVNFTNQSSDSDGTIVSYDWDFGDGNSSSTQDPAPHTFAAAGTYTVSLSVTDDDGATDSYSSSVTVTDEQPPIGGDIVLDGAITGNKVKKVTLTWTGATGATVTLYLNGDPMVITNSGSYIENLGKIAGGTFNYYIVDENGNESNLLDLSF